MNSTSTNAAAVVFDVANIRSDWGTASIRSLHLQHVGAEFSAYPAAASESGPLSLEAFADLRSPAE